MKFLAILILITSTLSALAENRVCYYTQKLGCRYVLADPDPERFLQLPFIHADDTPLFSKTKLKKLRALFDAIDSGKIGGFGYGQKSGIQLSKTPYVHLEFVVKHGKVMRAKIVGITETDERPEISKDFLVSLLQDIIDRMVQTSPSLQEYFESKKRGAAISFLRYHIEQGRQYPGFPWHYDYGGLQAITPISLPDDLEGAHLQLQKRPSFGNRNIIVDIEPKENYTVLFNNDQTWHHVTPFKVATGTALRDIFTVEIHDTPGVHEFGGFKRARK